MTHAVDIDVVAGAHATHFIALGRGARPTDDISASHQLAFCAGNVHDRRDGWKGQGQCGQEAESKERLHFGTMC